jgi:hypothetical protein
MSYSSKIYSLLLSSELPARESTPWKIKLNCSPLVNNPGGEGYLSTPPGAGLRKSPPPAISRLGFHFLYLLSFNEAV